MKAAVRREERRLQRIFRSARWLAVALPAACGAEEPAPAVGAGGGDSSEAAADVGNKPEGILEVHGSARDPGILSEIVARAPNDPGAPAAVPDAGAPAAAPDAGDHCAPQSIAPDPPDTCGEYVRLPCGLPAGVVPGSNCYLWLNDCKKVCPGFYFNCHAVDANCAGGKIVPDAKGAIDIDCSICNKGVGRIPAGLSSARIPGSGRALGDHFSVAAHLEAASVVAFRRLRSELAVHGAPARLLRAAKRAERDEVRHARLTGRMARRFGGAAVPPRVEQLPPRPLEAVAVENAVEGCVRETFGALVACWQAENAQDPEIARLMEGIARDETRHAALSWAVAGWAHRRLDAAARVRIVEQCRAAVASLRRETEIPVDGDLVARAGLPDAERQRALLAVLEQQLWSRLGRA